MRYYCFSPDGCDNNVLFQVIRDGVAGCDYLMCSLCLYTIPVAVADAFMRDIEQGRRTSA